jgi:hypothetical protein
MIRPSRMLREQDNWRDHGISFVKYLNVTTETLHGCVKDSKAAKYTKFSTVGYKAQKPQEGGGWEEFKVVPCETKDY